MGNELRTVRFFSGHDVTSHAWRARECFVRRTRGTLVGTVSIVHCWEQQDTMLAYHRVGRSPLGHYVTCPVEQQGRPPLTGRDDSPGTGNHE